MRAMSPFSEGASLAEGMLMVCDGIFTYEEKPPFHYPDWSGNFKAKLVLWKNLPLKECWKLFLNLLYAWSHQIRIAFNQTVFVFFQSKANSKSLLHELHFQREPTLECTQYWWHASPRPNLLKQWVTIMYSNFG